MLKKISIFTAVALLICMLFCVSAGAENVNAENYRLDVHCPHCDEIGLVYDGESGFFECKNEKCGYMYSIECPFCENNGFYSTESGLYVCNEIECGKALTLVEVQDSLVLSKKPSGGKLDKDDIPNFNDRLGIAIQGTVTGMLMVFAVLALLWGVVSISKVVFYDIPNKKKEREIKRRTNMSTPSVETESVVQSEAPAVPTAESDDGELAAVITAAIAAMIESGDYKDEFVGGFRVVSFKRSAKSAWNRK